MNSIAFEMLSPQSTSVPYRSKVKIFTIYTTPFLLIIDLVYSSKKII
jgi:hypothetical protein